MRNHRYQVSFEYNTGTKKGTIFGSLDSKIYNQEDITYLIRMLDPLRSEDMLNKIFNLTKNNIFVHEFNDFIALNGVSNIPMQRILTIKRN